MRFALAYDPDTAPVLWLPGHGFTPAWQPADFIGPRADCPIWFPAPDADVAYVGKVPPALAEVTPGGHIPNWGTWLPPIEPDAPQVTAASLAVPVDGAAPAAPWQPAQPPSPWGPGPGPDYPCQCVEVPPVNPPIPPIAPVPVEADAALFLITALAVLVWRVK